MDGYTRLAALMGRQMEYNIFRRYMSLRALRLLHLSAEVSHLAGDLGLVVDLDRASGDPERAQFESYYQLMHESKEDPGKALQMKAWTTLSAKLREYGEHHTQLMWRYIQNLMHIQVKSYCCIVDCPSFQLSIACI
jgi:hypothetical protein